MSFEHKKCGHPWGQKCYCTVYKSNDNTELKAGINPIGVTTTIKGCSSVKWNINLSDGKHKLYMEEQMLALQQKCDELETRNEKLELFHKSVMGWRSGSKLLNTLFINDSVLMEAHNKLKE